MKPREEVLRRAFRVDELTAADRAYWKEHLFDQLLVRTQLDLQPVNAIQEEQRRRLLAMRDAVFGAMARCTDPEATGYLSLRFNVEDDLAVQIAIVEALKAARALHAVPALISKLSSREPGLKSAVRQALAAIAGVDLGELRQPWDEWWKERSPYGRLEQIKVPVLSIGHWGKLGLHLRGNILGYEYASAPKKLMVTGAKDVFEAHALFDDAEFHRREVELKGRYLAV